MNENTFFIHCVSAGDVLLVHLQVFRSLFSSDEL